MKNNRGFTLIEVLISTILIAAVVVMVLWAINLARTGQERASKREDLLQIERTLYRKLVMPLRGIYPFYKRDEKGRPVLRFKGEPQSLSFVTTYTEPWRKNLANTTGLRWMKVFVDGDELKIKENLFFADEPEENSDEKLLYRGVEELRFEYLDPKEDLWTDEWDEDRNTLPLAIKVKLSFLYREKTIHMPPIVVYIRTARRGQL